MRRLDVRRGGQGETAGFLPVFLPGWRSVATVGSGLMQLKSVPGRLGAAPSVREAAATTTDRAQPEWPEHGPRAAGRRRKITNGRHRSAAKEQQERFPNGNHAHTRRGRNGHDEASASAGRRPARDRPAWHGPSGRAPARLPRRRTHLRQAHAVPGPAPGHCLRFPRLRPLRPGARPPRPRAARGGAGCTTP